jgi:hypothetical protein
MHATPSSAASATPSIVTFLSQLLPYTVTPQLYPHFISNSSTFLCMHTTPLSAASATPSIVTFLSQLLLCTVTPQLNPHFCSNSSACIKLHCILSVASATPVIATVLSQLLLYTVSSQLPILQQLHTITYYSSILESPSFLSLYVLQSWNF